MKAFDSNTLNNDARELIQPPANLTQQVAILNINGNANTNSNLVYFNPDYLCFNNNDANSIFSKNASLYHYTRESAIYSCIKSKENNVTYTFDEDNGTINLTVNSQWLPHEDINLNTTNGVVFADSPLTADSTIYQLFINQAMNQGSNYSNPSLSAQNQLATQFGSLVNIGGVSLQNSFIRSQSYWQTDFPKFMTSLILGDTNSYPGQWGNSIYYGGIHYGSNVNLQPFTVFSATPVIQGQASVPSTAQLLLNNQTLLGKADVNAGPFSISNIPVVNGNGTVTMLLQNNTGAVYDQITVPFYASPKILKEGVYQYRYDSGLPNTNPGGWNFGYQESNAFFSTDHLYGMTNNYTIDIHSEIQPTQLYDIGITHNFLVFNELVSTISTAASISPLGIGGLIGFGINRQVTDNSKISYGYNVTLTTQQFQQLGITTMTGQDYPIQQTLFINLPLTRSSSISLGTNQQTQIGTGTSNTYNSTFLWQIAKSLNFSLTGMYSIQPQGNPVISGYANLNYIFENASSIQNGIQSMQQGNQTNYLATTQYQYNDPTNTYGYNTGASYTGGNANNSSSTNATALNGGGFYNFKNFNTTMQASVENTNNYNFTGSIQGVMTLSGEGLSLGRYSNLSFALIKVGIPDVSVMLNGSYIGKTDIDGYFLLPNIQSYLPQKISLDPTTLPINVVLSEYEKTIVTPLNSGILVSFEAIQYTPAIMHLMTDSNTNQYAASGLPATLYEINETGDKEIENLIVGDSGLIQISNYSKKKKYYVLFSNRDGIYKCPVIETPTPDNSQYTIYMKDSICQKQL
jgi:outer membrane usher protein